MSNLFKLNWNDLLQAVIASVIAPTVVAFYSMFQSCGFLSSCYNWDDIGKVAVGSFIGLIITKFLSDESGRPLGLGR